MVLVVIASVALLLCMVVIVLGCLNCLQRKKPGFSNFNNASPSRDNQLAQHNAAFTVDMSDVEASREAVVIEPLPDIITKATDMPSLRPRMMCLERGKQEATLSLISIQRSFPREDLLFLDEIGSGWFGKAIESEALRISGGTLKSRVVVKMLKDDATKVEQKQFLDEVNAFRCLEHANLLSLLGQCTEAAPYLVILESAPHGNLKTFLMENRPEADSLIKKNQLISFALDIGSGLACLHRHDYLHNDLAVRNCVVMGDHNVKIGDYGISDVLFKEDYFDTGKELLPIRWMAPESLIQTEGVWTAQVSDKTSDVWSFGIVMWEILSLGEQPYSMLSDEAVLQGVVIDRLLLPQEVDTRIPFKEDLSTIMTQCWKNPGERPDIEQICHSLNQLLRQRVDTMDTMNDFDQKWNFLVPSRGASSSGADSLAGSRTALAGSFATVNSSSPEEASVMSDGAAVNTTQEAAAFVGAGFESQGISTSTPVSSKGKVQEMPQAVAAIANDIGDSRAGKIASAAENTSKSSPQDDSIIIENEVSRIEETRDTFEATVSSPSDLLMVTTSTPKNQQSQNSTAQFYSAESSRNSAYMSAMEKISSPEPSDNAPELLQGIGQDFSLDSNGLSLSEFADNTLQDPTPEVSKNYSNITDLDDLVMSKVEAKETADEETGDQFGDFVQTSPTAPRADFTDFEKASIGASSAGGVSEEFEVIEKTEAAEMETASMNDFSDFVVSANEEKAEQNQSSISVNNTAKDELADLSFSSTTGDKSADTVLPASSLSSTSHDALFITSAEVDPSSSLDSGLLTSDLSAQEQDAVKIEVSSTDPGSKEETEQNIFSENVSQGLEEKEVFGFASGEPEIPPQSSNNNSLLIGFGEDDLLSTPDPSLKSDLSLIPDPEGFLQFQASPSKPEESAFPDLIVPISENTQNFAPLEAEVPTVKEALGEAQRDLLPALNESNDFSFIEVGDQPPAAATSLTDQQQDLLLIGDTGSEKVGTDSKFESASSHSPESESGINSRSVTESLSNVAPTQDGLDSSDSLGFVDTSDPTGDSVISEGHSADQAFPESADFRLSPPSSFSGSNLYRSSHILLAKSNENLLIDSQNQESEPVVREKSPDPVESPEDSDSEVCSDSSETSSTSGSGKEYNCQEDVFSDTGQPPPSPHPQASSQLNSVSSNCFDSEEAPESSSYGDFDEQALRIASEIYLSKGVKSSRVYEIPPLETIPEHQPMPAISEDPVPTPSSDTSSVEVKYDDLFSSDGYEWDDFFDDPLMEDRSNGS
ncbi:uncharacterized protein LOC101855484 isoform X2 [Aplysia californica]|uniref:Uncharacterized protein LOC101855484 isoform X2 n=1 Tax=Aplysia californica TaxID=6500 RepID=A0ABM0JLN9_APLCA|nr:uncharacterized protein LOC101855484 isoform X2 [Aplysia californica]